MYQKTKDEKEDKIINTYGTIIVRTFGHKNCSSNKLRQEPITAEWVPQLQNLVGRVRVLPLTLYLFIYF